MSGKTRQTDLIVRIRYQNPLPPPPFPPRPLHIATDPARYATYDFLLPLANERELPMVLDTELGMPLEMGKMTGKPGESARYWMGMREGVNPDPSSAPVLDEEDQFLLGDTSSHPPGFFASSSRAMAPAETSQGAKKQAYSERPRQEVSWLRKTEYMTSSDGSRTPVGARGALMAKQESSVLLPTSREERVSSILDTFKAASQPIETIQHPSKKGVVAIEEHELLPDETIWANDYNLLRFTEDPSSTKPGWTRMDGTEGSSGTDPRLSRAIFRPLEFLNSTDSRISYYLPHDTDMTTRYEAERSAGTGRDVLDDDKEEYEFRYIRDYEIATNRPLANEFMFVEPGTDDMPYRPFELPRSDTAKTMYYVPVMNHQTVRKRRLRADENMKDYPGPTADGIEQQFWDSIKLKLVNENAWEEATRVPLRDEIAQPPPDGRLYQLRAAGTNGTTAKSEGDVLISVDENGVKPEL